MDYQVYLLIHSADNKTYVGITNNLPRRIRQHNGEIVGGAKYTTRNLTTGFWSIYGIIPNLSKSLSLSFERKIKIKSKKMNGNAIDRRLKSIAIILNEYNEKNNTSYSFNKI